MSSRPEKQPKKLWKILFTVICVTGLLAVWLGFGKKGYVLYRTKAEEKAYSDRIQSLTEDNKVLLEEIDRLRNDKDYVKSVARQNFSMIESNQVIYRFKDDSKQDNTSISPQE